MNEAFNRSSSLNIGICVPAVLNVSVCERALALYVWRGERSVAARSSHHLNGHVRFHACAFKEAQPLML